MNRNPQSRLLRFSIMLLMVAVAASFVARLTEATTLGLAARWLCALAFPGALLLFALALPRQTGARDGEPPHSITTAGRSSTC